MKLIFGLFSLITLINANVFAETACEEAKNFITKHADKIEAPSPSGQQATYRKYFKIFLEEEIKKQNEAECGRMLRILKIDLKL